MIQIGKIVKAQGIKGEVKIIPVDKVERYLNLKSVFIDKEEKVISNMVARQGALFIKFENINDRNTSELLRGKDVFAKEKDLKALKENEFYFKDLIGVEIYDEKGEKIGELTDIEQYGAADVVSIRERNVIFSVPFIEDIFIKIESRKITVNREEYDSIKIFN